MLCNFVRSEEVFTTWASWEDHRKTIGEHFEPSSENVLQKCQADARFSPDCSTVSDVYYRQSKIDGYRARSAYKLLHLDEQFGFFGQNEMYALGGTLETELQVLRSELQRLRAKDAGADADDVEELEEEIEELQSALEYAAKLPSTSKQGSKTTSRPTRAVDLCAAPGSWSQVLVQRLPTGPQTRIVSVDLQPMAPIAGVHQILGDITTQATAHAVANALAGENNADEARAQLIVCDGAPDVTGIHDVDEYLQAQLLLSALQITMRLLEAGGTFIAKIFCQKHSVGKSTSTLPNQRGDTSALLVEQMKQLFELVDVAKPRSSRIASHEHFIGECDSDRCLKGRKCLRKTEPEADIVDAIFRPFPPFPFQYAATSAHHHN